MSSSKRNLSDFSLFYNWINSASNMLETPKLYSLDSEKKLREWQMKGRLIKPNNHASYGQNWDLLKDSQLSLSKSYLDGSVELPASDFQYWIESGYIDGKNSRYAPSYTEEKNVGKDGKRRKNYRNLVQSGCIAMQSKYLKRLEEGAKLSTDELNVDPAGLNDKNTMYWAMLATKYKEDYSSMVFPCYAQIKLNGVRMISYISDKEAKTSGDVITYSRDLKEIPGISAIKDALMFPLKELYNEDSDKSIRIDGEIFGFDVPLNEISGWARNATSNNTDATKKIGYFIFDLFDPGNSSLTFEERIELMDSIKGLADGELENRSFPFNLDKSRQLAENDYKRAVEHFRNAQGTIETHGKRTEEQEFLKDEYPFDSFQEWYDTIIKIGPDVTKYKSFVFTTIGSLTFVPTLKVNTKSELLALYYAAVDLKFEGLMARNAKGFYYTSTENKTTENRSIDLQKLKPWYDEEFEVVNYTTGKGRNNGAIIWVCKTASGNEFNCDPKNMTIDARKLLYAEFQAHPNKFKNEYQGLKMTVQYEEKNIKSGIPQRAKALGIRNFG